MTNLLSQRKYFQSFPFHLVDQSPWPLVIRFTLFTMAIGAVAYFQGFNYGGHLLFLGFILTVSIMILWFRDVTLEATYLGHHTFEVRKGLTLGFALFVVSEIFVFLSVFWSYFHSSLAPTIEIGSSWPPLGITPLDPFAIPLLNTILLLSSGAFVTWSHHALIQGNRAGAIYGAIATVILAIVFTGFQGVEYSVSSFTISDGAFGTCFYFGTGFHVFHVIIGTLFLGVGLWIIYAYHLTDNHHLGFEGGILYWHFVDVVWLFLYVSIYYWGS